ncbi:MAG: hypothetical protein ACK53J_15250, partial [Betaproteobacteria bacterium]
MTRLKRSYRLVPRVVERPAYACRSASFECSIDVSYGLHTRIDEWNAPGVSASGRGSTAAGVDASVVGGVNQRVLKARQ